MLHLIKAILLHSLKRIQYNCFKGSVTLWNAMEYVESMPTLTMLTCKKASIKYTKIQPLLPSSVCPICPLCPVISYVCISVSYCSRESQTWFVSQHYNLAQTQDWVFYLPSPWAGISGGPSPSRVPSQTIFFSLKFLNLYLFILINNFNWIIMKYTVIKLFVIGFHSYTVSASNPSSHQCP